MFFLKKALLPKNGREGGIEYWHDRRLVKWGNGGQIHRCTV
jgi:hypothetical protein